MKKRIISAILASSLLLASVIGLSACEHECTFDNGKITVEPTPTSIGERTYTCVICDKTRAESEEFNGLSQTRWQEATKDAIFLNITITKNGTAKATEGETVTDEQSEALTIKLTNNKILEFGTVTSAAGENSISSTYENEQMLFKRADVTSIIKVIISKRDAFEYSKDNKLYTAKEAISSAMLLDDKGATLTVTNCTLAMTDDGKLSEISCDYTLSADDGTKTLTASYVWEFSSHDTTTID